MKKIKNQKNDKNPSKKIDFFDFFRKGQKTKKIKKVKEMKKIRDPGSPRVGGFWPWESLLSRILSGSRLEPWLEPLTLPAGAPWIFLIFLIFFIFLIFLIFSKNQKMKKIKTKCLIFSIFFENAPKKTQKNQQK